MRMQVESLNQYAAVNQKRQTAFTRMKTYGDSDNSNRSRYRQGEYKALDGRTSAKLTHTTE